MADIIAAPNWSLDKIIAALREVSANAIDVMREDKKQMLASIAADEIARLRAENDRLCAERDSARLCATQAEAQLAVAVGALDEIAASHIPDQPTAYGYTDLAWTQKWVGNLRHLAVRRLATLPTCARLLLDVVEAAEQADVHTPECNPYLFKLHDALAAYHGTGKE